MTNDLSEVWRAIPGFEGSYEVSNFGNIKGIQREVKHPQGGTRTVKEKVLKLVPSKKGEYFIVYLGRNNRKFVHRLVGEAFLQRPKNTVQINHKDGNKQNNHLSNLEWVTRSENMQHAYDIGLNHSGMNHYKAKSGRIVHPDGDQIVFKCQSDLCKEFNLHHGSVSRVLSGKAKSHKGWTNAKL